MIALSRYFYSLVAVGLIATALPASAALVAADDFDDADGTLLDGKAPDVGANWRVTQGGGDLDVQGGVLDTTGAGRTGFLDFAGGKALGAGELLTMRLTTQDPSGSNFFSGGYAGFSFFEGSDASEVMFIGDTGGGEFWGLDQTLVGGTTLSTNNDPDATAVFTYSFDSGAYALTIDGAVELSGTGTANLAVDRFRFVNGGGGDLIMDSLAVDISTEVPEPASVVTVVLAFTGLAVVLRGRRA
ncbi:hypothetical protein NG895_24495 [Aeoliella sp. ICT_H6.2]|uniref:PEP-CTERM protein-sorting domain-containing protein n=1 Tax=Aeoliella straminimaris TaxID=2954799 RepID=A0A9X2FDR2_9BACT|nr:hypothetical protein [Aeoliella straminimaris]MCO6047070.1 hypothetical protein [Aeoliella straminimaris]